MLGRRHHTGRLATGNNLGCQHTCQVRILRERLVSSTAEGGTLNVHGWPEPAVYALGDTLEAEELTSLAEKLPVPCRSQGGTARD